MTKKIPLRPGHPERICWGCEQLCAADDMRCGNGTDRTQHPIELWGEDWTQVGLDAESKAQPSTDPEATPGGTVKPLAAHKD